jgi:hypothetical protein
MITPVLFAAISLAGFMTGVIMQWFPAEAPQFSGVIMQLRFGW